jgi:hypothetical protein
MNTSPKAMLALRAAPAGNGCHLKPALYNYRLAARRRSETYVDNSLTPPRSFTLDRVVHRLQMGYFRSVG